MTTPLDLLTGEEAQPEVIVNQALEALEPAALFARRASTTGGTTWGYYGGTINVDGVPTTVANGTVSLTASVLNYVEATRAGVVSANTSAFTPGRIPLYTVHLGTGVYVDYRAWAVPGVDALAAVSIPSDANYTLSAAEASCDVLEVASGVSLGATRNVVVPVVKKQWTVLNKTTGSQSIQFIGASGTGITVANGKRAILYCDGTNVVRVTADT